MNVRACDPWPTCLFHCLYKIVHSKNLIRLSCQEQLRLFEAPKTSIPIYYTKNVNLNSEDLHLIRTISTLTLLLWESFFSGKNGRFEDRNGIEILLKQWITYSRYFNGRLGRLGRQALRLLQYKCWTLTFKCWLHIGECHRSLLRCPRHYREQC